MALTKKDSLTLGLVLCLFYDRKCLSDSVLKICYHNSYAETLTRIRCHKLWQTKPSISLRSMNWCPTKDRTLSRSSAGCHILCGKYTFTSPPLHTVEARTTVHPRRDQRRHLSFYRSKYSSKQLFFFEVIWVLKKNSQCIENTLSALQCSMCSCLQNAEHAFGLNFNSLSLWFSLRCRQLLLKWEPAKTVQKGVYRLGNAIHYPLPFWSLLSKPQSSMHISFLMSGIQVVVHSMRHSGNT